MFKDVMNEVQEELKSIERIDDEVVRKLIYQCVANHKKSANLPLSEKESIFKKCFNALRGLGILQELIDDDRITEIMVNGHQSIFIEKDGEIIKTDLEFECEEKLNDIIQKIVSGVDRSVNTASPIVDARLHGGARVSVVLPPVALNGPVVTIRKFKSVEYDFKELESLGSISHEAVTELVKWMKARYNIFIAGGTGSGKTTFLNVLSQHIPQNQRVITIEDSAELQLSHLDNWVRLETRNKNSEGLGEIKMNQLIRTALRMRPDRIIVGEVRGEETLDMLQAMNTGHDGSLSTGHANSVMDMLKRLETMVLSSNQIPMDGVRQQIVSAIDIIVYLSRLRDKSRRVVAIDAMDTMVSGEYRLVSLFEFVDCGDDVNNKVIGKLIRTPNSMPRLLKLQRAGLV